MEIMEYTAVLLGLDYRIWVPIFKFNPTNCVMTLAWQYELYKYTGLYQLYPDVRLILCDLGDQLEWKSVKEWR